MNKQIRISSKSSHASENEISILSNKSESSRMKIYSPISICILSPWSFYGNFKQFLNVLYQISLSSSNIPVENVVESFISKVPRPIPRGSILSLKFDHGIVAVSPIMFTLPKELGLP